MVSTTTTPHTSHNVYIYIHTHAHIYINRTLVVHTSGVPMTEKMTLSWSKFYTIIDKKRQLRWS